MSALIQGENPEISNSDYHADKEHLSSSNLKLILQDSEAFYKERILGIYEQKTTVAMEDGSYVHALILEPHKVAKYYALFEGWRKAGKEFEAFKAEAGRKTIISKPQDFRCQKLLAACQSHPVASKLLKTGVAEHTMCSKIGPVPIKSRADFINIEEGYIVDVKTTSHESGLDFFKMAVDQYMYQLSAALYCQIASDTYRKPFDFYFVVLSKNDGQCEVYKASRDTLMVGSALVAKAIKKYLACLESGNWKNEAPPALSALNTNYEILEV